MKHYSRIILMGLIVFCSVVCANEELLNGQIPEQSFHQANATNNNTDQNGDAVAMQKVQEIMARAHQMQVQKEKQEQQAPEMQAAPASKPVTQTSAPQSSAASQNSAPPQSSAPKTIDFSIPTGDVKTQLTLLAQQNLLFRQQMDTKIESLTTQNHELQTKLQQFSQVLAAMNQEVIQVTSRQKNLAKTTPFFSEQAMQYSLYAIIALLLTVIGLLILRQKRDRPAKSMTPKQAAFAQSMVAAGVVPMKPAALLDDTQDEYDFMGSKEAIPAKLDLARAYIAMEDYSSARKALQEVMKLGTEEQRLDALKLFEKIPATE